MTPQYKPTTGIADVDRAIGGVMAGDNLVLGKIFDIYTICIFIDLCAAETAALPGQ